MIKKHSSASALINPLYWFVCSHKAHCMMLVSQATLCLKYIFSIALLLNLREPCIALGRRPVAFRNTILKNNLFFSSPVSQEHSGWVLPKMNWKPSDTYHPLHFISETLFAMHIEWSRGDPRAWLIRGKQMRICIISKGIPFFLCFFQMGRWRWRRRVWNFAPWGRGRCLESWLFSTTAPGRPLSRVSLHRHLEDAHRDENTLKCCQELWVFLPRAYHPCIDTRREGSFCYCINGNTVGMIKHYPSLLPIFAILQSNVLREAPVSWMLRFTHSILSCVDSASYEGCIVG